MKVFVSYSWKQEDEDHWVWDSLVPVLKAGGVELLIDRRDMQAGRKPWDQTDAWQAEADCQVLVLSPAYFESENCQHEFAVAVSGSQAAFDQGQRSAALDSGRIIPVLRVTMDLPHIVNLPLSPNLVDPPSGLSSSDRLAHDRRLDDNWNMLLKACDADLGTSARHWLDVRNRLRRRLDRHDSAHLQVSGKPKWSELMDHLAESLPAPGLHRVDLDSGGMAKRHRLLSAMLGRRDVVSAEDDLLEFEQSLSQKPGRSRIALKHFDHVKQRNGSYGIDLFSTWRSLMDRDRLTLLFQSRSPLLDLIPQELQESPAYTSIESIELKGG